MSATSNELKVQIQCRLEGNTSVEACGPPLAQSLDSKEEAAEEMFAYDATPQPARTPLKMRWRLRQKCSSRGIAHMQFLKQGTH